MSISAISLAQLEGLTHRIENGNYSSYQEQAQAIQSLFSQAFYNSGSSSKAGIKLEMDRLEAYIKRLQPEVEKTYEQLRTMNAKVQQAHEELVKELAEIAAASEEYTQEQYDVMNKAVEQASVMYMDGDITKEEMPGKIAQLIESNNPEGAARIRNMMASSQGKSSEVNTLVTNLTSLFTRADNMSAELASANASLSLMKLVYAKTGDAVGGYSNDDNSATRPIYTPAKEALVTNWDKQYTEGNVTDLEDAIGKGYLQNLKDQGFTFKEAMFATEFIFGKSGISYELGQTATVPNGAIYDTFCNQVKELWGKDCERLPENTQVNPDTGEIETINPPSTGGDHDPIGWVDGNVTYDFVIDRNGDNIFNGKEEFLGINDGWAELVSMDKNNDGKVNGEELNGFMVLRNDHTIGDFGFMSAEMAGLTEIDLASYQENNYVNVNGNTEAGNFNLTVNGRQTQGRQTLDTDEYLNTAFGGGFGREYTIKLTDAETRDIYAELNKNKNPLTQGDIDAAKNNQRAVELEAGVTAAAVIENEIEAATAKSRAVNAEAPAKDESEDEKKKKEEQQQ